MTFLTFTFFSMRFFDLPLELQRLVAGHIANSSYEEAAAVQQTCYTLWHLVCDAMELKLNALRLHTNVWLRLGAKYGIVDILMHRELRNGIRFDLHDLVCQICPFWDVPVGSFVCLAVAHASRELTPLGYGKGLGLEFEVKRDIPVGVQIVVHLERGLAHTCRSYPLTASYECMHCQRQFAKGSSGLLMGGHKHSRKRPRFTLFSE